MTVQTEKNASSKTQTTIQSTLLKVPSYTAKAITATAAFFYGGPYSAIVAREAFTQGYDFFVRDISNCYTPSCFAEYYGFVAPMREHLGVTAYQYGGLALAAASIPALMLLEHGISYVGSKCLNLFKSSPQQATPVEDITLQLNDMHLEDDPSLPTTPTQEITEKLANLNLDALNRPNQETHEKFQRCLKELLAKRSKVETAITTPDDDYSEAFTFLFSENKARKPIKSEPLDEGLGIETNVEVYLLNAASNSGKTLKRTSSMP